MLLKRRLGITSSIVTDSNIFGKRHDHVDYRPARFVCSGPSEWITLRAYTPSSITFTSWHQYVTYESAFAFGRGTLVIPIVLKPTDFPPRLESLQHLAFFNARLRPWNRLFKILEEQRNSSSSDKQMCPISVREHAWIRYPPPA